MGWPDIIEENEDDAEEVEEELEADDDTKEVGVEVRSEPGSGEASNWSITRVQMKFFALFKYSSLVVFSLINSMSLHILANRFNLLLTLYWIK